MTDKPDSSPEVLRIGTLGGARITPKALLAPAAENPGCEVVSVAARDPERASDYARQHAIPRTHENYRALIEDPEIDIVYNPLPISEHRAWTLAAVQAGKHVLCEKPFTLNQSEARDVASAAEESGVTVVEAFHTRYHPLMLRSITIVRSGVLGSITSAEAFFEVPISDTPQQIRYRYELGGGATMDIGCYPLHWLRHLLGREPRVERAEAVVGPPKVDVAMTAELDFDGVPAIARCDMGEDRKYACGFVVRGTEATLEVVNPLAPQLGHSVTVTPADDARGVAPQSEELSRRMTFDYQLEAFLAAVRSHERGEHVELPTDAADAVVSMRVIDAVYQAAGLPVRGT